MIQPGPETDLAVAKACGFRGPQILTGPAIPDGRCFRLTPDDETKCIPPIEKAFCPSTDLNDAFLAAEKLGLFNYHDGLLSLCKNGPGGADAPKWGFIKNKYATPWQWWMWPDDKGGYTGISVTTPALAICAAILKLAEKA